MIRRIRRKKNMTSSEIFAERLHAMVDPPAAETRTKGMDEAMWDSFRTASIAAGDGHAIGLRTAEARSRALSPAESYAQVIAVNAAVRAIASNISRARLRLFLPDGREIVNGPLWELFNRPAPMMTTRRWLYDIACWYNIDGEWYCDVHHPRGSDVPTALLPLVPRRLDVETPSNPRSRGDVSQWRYRHLDGTHVLIRGDHVIGDTLFNPGDSIRGLAPTLVGQLVIGGAHAIDRYNKGFFDNSGIPSHIVVLGEGTSKQQRDDFARRYMAEYAAYRDNAFKAMVVSGKDVKIEPIEQPFQDGAFMELKKSITQDIAMLYHVPAIEMGIYDKSRFDTAAEERKLFVESTLTPQMDAISEALQTQFVDRFWQFQPRYNRQIEPRKTRMSKAMDARFEQARHEREDSRVIVLLDPDTLPIMAAVKAHAIATAKEFRDTLDMSAKEVADYFDFDIEDRPEREKIWKLNNYVCISDPEFNARLNPKSQPAPAAPPKDNGRPPKPENKALDAAGRKLLKGATRLSRRLRRLTLAALDEGGIWSLDEADALARSMDLGGAPVRRMIRLVRNDLRKSLDAAPDPKAAARRYFNHQPIRSQLGI